MKNFKCDKCGADNAARFTLSWRKYDPISRKYRYVKSKKLDLCETCAGAYI